MNEFGIETRVGEQGIALLAGGDPFNSDSEILATQHGLKARGRQPEGFFRPTKNLNGDFSLEAFFEIALRGAGDCILWLRRDSTMIASKLEWRFSHHIFIASRGHTSRVVAQARSKRRAFELLLKLIAL